jgi:CheY-like chemotaxis protein
VKTGITQGYILGDAGLLQQMLLNICNNAREAMTKPGEEDAVGSLILSLEYATGEFIERKFGNSSAERYIALCVQDTGRGMQEEVRRKMFEPFFTTKDIGKGTGLGLSIVHGIVRSHHGIIDVESGPQGGTRFIVYLPQTDQSPGFVEEEKPERLPGTGEHILIVEDEDDVRSLLMEWLSEAGYVPSEAADGAQALDIIRGNGKFQLVLADIGLPKLDGVQLFGELRKFRPDIPVVFCTGFIDEDRHAKLMETGARAIIRKPYRIDDVLNAIHSSLAS